MKSYGIDAGSCRVQLREQGAGFPVLLLHSLAFDGSMWQAQLDALAGYRLVAPDLRGHGSTRCPSPAGVELDDLVDDVERLLDRLEIASAACCGLSLGGMVAMRLALRCPDRIAALVLMNTSADEEDVEMRGHYDRINEQSRGRPASEAVVDFLVTRMFSPAFVSGAPDKVTPWREKLMLPGDPEGLYQVSRAVIWRSPVLEELGRLRLPTLVVVSGADTAIPPAHGHAIASAIPRTELARLPGCGHMAPLERPGEINQLLDRFLDSALENRT